MYWWRLWDGRFVNMAHVVDVAFEPNRSRAKLTLVSGQVREVEGGDCDRLRILVDEMTSYAPGFEVGGSRGLSNEDPDEPGRPRRNYIMPTEDGLFTVEGDDGLAA